MHKLKEIRKLRGLSQKELAKLVETSSVNISYLEIKKRGMSENWIEKLSKALRCTKAQLLGEEPLSELARLPQEIQQDQRTFLHIIRSKMRIICRTTLFSRYSSLNRRKTQKNVRLS